MFNTHFRPILIASVTFIAVAVIWPGVSKAATEGAVGQEGASAMATPPAGGVASISSEQAKLHIGETNTVCGLVASAKYLTSAKTKPTLLNFDRPFPDHTFSVMIADADRATFTGPPEMMFEGKTICVTGRIIDFHGKPEIVVTNASQIAVSAAAPAALEKAATNTVEKTPAPATAP